MRIKKILKQHKYFILMLVMFICFGLFMSTFFTLESDYFWHITTGKYILNSGKIINHDIFSWVLNGKYWFSHEWLFDYFIYFLSIIFGKSHLYIYIAFSLVLLFCILFLSNYKGYLKNIYFTLIWLLFFLIFSVFIQGRPHLLSFSFLALTLSLCFDLYNNSNSRKIYFLPLISILWSNFHGGSSNLSYIFPLIFLISGLFNFNFRKIYSKKLSDNQINRYLFVSILSMISICFNPHGFKMLLYPYSNMLDSTMINFISEWQPTTLNSISNYPYFILIIFIFLIMIFSDKKIRFLDLVLFGISLFLGLKSVRFWAYTLIIMNFVVFEYIKKRRLCSYNVILIIFICLFSLIGFGTRLKSCININFNRYLDSNVIAVIKKERPKRLFNMYNYGGELIYNGIPVFVDGRADLYSKYNLKDYQIISTLGLNYSNIIDKYKFDYLLVSKDYPIYTYLYNNKLYENIYENKNLVLYKTK